MANTYKLTINDIPKENLNLGLTYNQKDESTQTLSINNTIYKCTLNKFSYKKAIYQPGEILIELQVGKESNAAISFSEVKDIHNAFIGKFFQLQYTGKKTLNIAKDYYSFDVKIEKQGSGKPLTVQIQAFDPLKFLTLDKYCMAYTCKKLVTDIITNIDIWPNNLPKKLKEAITEDRKSITEKENNLNNKKKASNTSENDITKAIEELNTEIRNWWDKKDGFFVKNPQFITYETKTNNNSDNSSDPKKNYEFIQPYLVQYNESFLDFLVRVTNRCGEFFFYEGGKIHIGWKATDPIIIQEYVSVKFPQEIHTAWDNKAIADIHNDYTREKGKNLINFDSPKVMRDSELAFDENLAKIPPKDKYTSWQDFALFPGCFFVTNVSGALNSATLVEMLEYLAFNSAASMSNGLVLSLDTNNSYEESNFDSGKPYFNERKNGDDLHPFSTNDTNKSLNSMTAYCLDFYTNIRNGIESAERSCLQIELGDHYCEASLGSLIQFEGDTQQYIVIKIESQIDSQSDKLGLSGGETLSIEVIPYTKGQTVYPPSAHVEPIRLAKAQRAIITHNQDPLKMNRVRVRYPWQGKTESADDLKASEDSTPWIRIALPMASDGSGFNFLPEVGDEAIINYENGNIEKPYVEGMLYSSKTAVPASHKRNNARVLSSVNGHCIIFSDPGASTNAIKGLFPAWNTICSFFPTVLKGSLKDDVRKAMGGIELTDEYGLYSISMSSEKRAISVDSPLGKVEINAFTGITISAPNGDIRIEGKNITLAAGNNVTIESGINKKTNFCAFSKENLMDVGKSIAARFMTIDMRLVRTVIETFLRPIGGTMLIKSNRYLLLEAGKGEINIANREVMRNFGIRDSIKSIYFTKKPGSQGLQYEPNEIYSILQQSRNFIFKLYDSHQLLNRQISVLLSNYNRHFLGDSNRFINYATIKEYIKNENEILSLSQLIDRAKNKKPLINIELKEEEEQQDINNPNPQQRNEAQNLITQFNQCSKALYETIKDNFETDIWNKEKSNFDKIDDIIEIKEINIKKQIEEIYAPVYWENSINNAQHIRLINITNVRKVLYDILKYLIDKQDVSNVYLKIKIGEKPKSFNKDDWKNFVNHINTINESNPSFLSNKLMMFMGEAAKTKGMLDQYIWDKIDDGKILFSDQEDEALDFKDKQIHTYESNLNQDNSRVKDIKTLLKSL